MGAMKVVLLGTEDWEALYIDGHKKEEGHRLDLSITLEKIYQEFREGDQSFWYEGFYFEPETDEEREEWEMGIYYEPKLEDVDPHLRQGISA
jgi:hypothetical protein